MKGLWLWAHYLPRDPAVTVAAARAAGASGLLIKYHDGSSCTDNTGFDYRAAWLATLPALRAAGIAAAAWGYVYPGEARAQAALIGQAFADGAEFYVFDAEVEFEGSAGGRPAAEDLIGAARAAVPSGSHLAYTTFAIADLHPRFPFAAFDAACELALPQVYWASFGWTVDQAYNRCWTSMRAAGCTHAAWQPVGQLTPPATTAQLRRFAWLCHNGGVPGISLWLLDEMGAPAMVDVACQPYSSPPAAPTPADFARNASTPQPDVAGALVDLADAQRKLQPS